MHQVFISSYAQNTLQRLAHLRPEGERDGPKLPDCSPVFFIILLLLLLLLLEACRACVGRAQRKSTVHELCTAHSARRRKKKRGSHKPRRTYDNIYIIIIIYEKSQMYHPCGARFARPIIILRSL